VLPCVSSIISTTSIALATGGGDLLYYLNESRATEQIASAMNLALVKLPATKGSRQSINVQIPTAILMNLPAYLAYVGGIRADGSELSKPITAVWGGLRDRH
jgi:TRAP-type uncharacterized transport system substrate-binding protein